jgi:hypothetical protein
MVIKSTERSDVPLLVTVTVFAGDVSPTGIFPTFTNAGETEITGLASAAWHRHHVRNKKLTLMNTALKKTFFILPPLFDRKN